MIALEDTYNHKEIFQKSVDNSDVNILEEKKNNQKPEKNEENNLLRKKENIKTPKKNKENIKSQENKKIKTPDNHEETIKIEKIQKIKTKKKNKEINIIENKEKVKTYDKEKEDSYILYLDANALYSGAMTKFLPYKEFEWNTEEWDKKKILTIDDKADTGYTLSVDLHIPEELIGNGDTFNIMR